MTQRALIAPFRILASIALRENGAEHEDLEGATATKIANSFKGEFRNDHPLCTTLESSTAAKSRASVFKLINSNILTCEHQFWDKRVVYNSAENILSRKGKQKEIYYTFENAPLNQTFDPPKAIDGAVPSTMQSAYENNPDPFTNLNPATSSPITLNQSMLAQNRSLLQEMMNQIKEENRSVMDEFKTEITKNNDKLADYVAGTDRFKELIKSEVNDAMTANGAEVADEVLAATKDIRESIETDYDAKVNKLQATINSMQIRLDSLDAKAHKSVTKVETMEDVWKSMISPKNYSDLEVTQAQTEHSKLAQQYKSETFRAKKNGSIMINCLKNEFYKHETAKNNKDEDIDVYTPDRTKIENLMGLKAEIYLDGVRVSKADNPIFRAEMHDRRLKIAKKHNKSFKADADASTSSSTNN